MRDSVIYDFSIETIDLARTSSGGRPCGRYTNFLNLNTYDRNLNLIYKTQIQFDSVSFLNNSADEVRRYILKEMPIQLFMANLNKDEVLKKLNFQKKKLENRLLEVSNDFNNVRNYWDFLYFSITNISNSDILPKSTTSRLVVAGQMLLNIFIVGFLILTRSRKPSVKKKNKPISKTRKKINEAMKAYLKTPE